MGRRGRWLTKPHLIEDYALIGDCETAALVSRDGSVDWLCWPRFDSPACFAALLGAPSTGAGASPRATRAGAHAPPYRGDTLVLETTMETPDGGAVALIDFMPPRAALRPGPHRPRPARARADADGAGAALRLRPHRALGDAAGRRRPARRGRAAPGDAPHERADARRELHTVAEFEVGEGEDAVFVLTHSESHLPPPEPTDPRLQLGETEAFWADWIGSCSDRGPWTEAVKRSLLTLKALTYRPTGGIVAAPTTSLPEAMGGSRNWDYRFCWLRDSALLLTALTGAGFLEEAAAWRDWLIRAVAGSPDQVQIMYGRGGRAPPHGNRTALAARLRRLAPGAHRQRRRRAVQLDVLGEVIDALFQAHQRGLGASATGWALARASWGTWKRLARAPTTASGRCAARRGTSPTPRSWSGWLRPRGPRRRALSLDAPVERWRRVRDEVHAEVCAKGFDPEIGAFTQSYGSRSLDASLLQIPLGGLPAGRRPRGARHGGGDRARADEDGLVCRYDTGETDDGLEGEEGTFLACSFWLVEAMHLKAAWPRRTPGSIGCSRSATTSGCSRRSTTRASGARSATSPQAFSHVALCIAALCLGGEENPRPQRAPPPKQG
jgi:GH15 family glucan-1,4-alpha-glucosidase